ncbi:MAG: LuxR family, similar to vsrD [Acidobacteria bacterium]|nr:LuxR family, similar to vsrD [Acidobacteriota bacterium]
MIAPAMPAPELEAKKNEILSLLDNLHECLTGPRPEGKPLHEKLSAREREVFDRMLSGKRLKEIAIDLDISVKTVTTHRCRLMKKLAVDDNLGLYRYGIRQGFIGV